MATLESKWVRENGKKANLDYLPFSKQWFGDVKSLGKSKSNLVCFFFSRFCCLLSLLHVFFFYFFGWVKSFLNKYQRNICIIPRFRIRMNQNEQQDLTKNTLTARLAGKRHKYFIDRANICSIPFFVFFFLVRMALSTLLCVADGSFRMCVYILIMQLIWQMFSSFVSRFSILGISFSL